MPASARAVPLGEDHGDAGPVLADAETLVRAFLDAVADGMPRSPGAVKATGTTAFAAVRPVKVPKLRRWAEDVSADLDSRRAGVPADRGRRRGRGRVPRRGAGAQPGLARRSWWTPPTCGRAATPGSAAGPGSRRPSPCAGPPAPGPAWRRCSTAPSPTNCR
ncbi:hypothetical protein ACFSTC_26380 [Nonomuraea ferruginea]